MKHLTIFSLNTFDAAATAIGLWLGLLSEANPLLAPLSIGALLLVKLVPINYLILILFNHRDNRVCQYGTWLVLGVYVHIFILHLTWIGAVL